MEFQSANHFVKLEDHHRLVGTENRNWDLPNASPLRYHGATLHGEKLFR